MPQRNIYMDLIFRNILLVFSIPPSIFFLMVISSETIFSIQRSKYALQSNFQLIHETQNFGEPVKNRSTKWWFEYVRQLCNLFQHKTRSISSMYTVPYQISVLRTQRVVVGRQFAVLPQKNAVVPDNSTEMFSIFYAEVICVNLWYRIRPLLRTYFTVSP